MCVVLLIHTVALKLISVFISWLPYLIFVRRNFFDLLINNSKLLHLIFHYSNLYYI